MKIAVVGSRSFRDYDVMCSILDVFTITEVISGGAEGADRLAERYAQERNISINVLPAEWDKFPGHQAAYERNRLMVELCEAVIAFWDGGSRGTRMTMELCWKSGKPLTIIRTDLLGGEA